MPTGREINIKYQTYRLLRDDASSRSRAHLHGSLLLWFLRSRHGVLYVVNYLTDDCGGRVPAGLYICLVRD